MACSITLSGIAIDCGASGSIKNTYLIPTADVTTVALATVSGITSISTITPASGKKLKQYAFRRGNATVNTECTVDDKIGSRSYTTTISLTFIKQEATKRQELEELAKGQVYVVVEDYNNQYFFIGYGDYVSLTKFSSEFGAMKNEFNGYKVELQAVTSESPYLVDSSVITPLL